MKANNLYNLNTWIAIRLNFGRIRGRNPFFKLHLGYYCILYNVCLFPSLGCALNRNSQTPSSLSVVFILIKILSHTLSYLYTLYRYKITKTAFSLTITPKKKQKKKETHHLPQPGWKRQMFNFVFTFRFIEFRVIKMSSRTRCHCVLSLWSSIDVCIGGWKRGIIYYHRTLLFTLIYMYMNEIVKFTIITCRLMIDHTFIPREK